MFFYHFDLLDSFMKSDFIVSLKKEKESIIQIINLYQSKKLNFLNITTNIMLAIDSVDKNEIEEEFYQTILSFKESFEGLENIESLANKLKDDLILTISLYDKGLDDNTNEIKANLVEYNKQKDELFNKIMDFENANTATLNSLTDVLLKLNKKKPKKINKVSNNTIETEKVAKVDVEIEPQDNNILIISEKDQKAYLPFFYSEIEKIYKASENQYSTLQDVVNDLYVVPLNRFQNSSVSRFRETFNLVRNKNKGSIIKAFDLGLELMFKYELNPIVIAACRNLDELDIYLDYLENGETDKFTCFNVIFDVAPIMVKNKKIGR